MNAAPLALTVYAFGVGFSILATRPSLRLIQYQASSIQHRPLLKRLYL